MLEFVELECGVRGRGRRRDRGWVMMMVVMVDGF